MKGVHGVLEGRAGAEPEVTAQAHQDQQSNPFALVKGDKTLASIPCPDPPQVAAKKRTNRDNGGVINEASIVAPAPNIGADRLLGRPWRIACRKPPSTAR